MKQLYSCSYCDKSFWSTPPGKIKCSACSAVDLVPHATSKAKRKSLSLAFGSSSSKKRLLPTPTGKENQGSLVASLFSESSLPYTTTVNACALAQTTPIKATSVEIPVEKVTVARNFRSGIKQADEVEISLHHDGAFSTQGGSKCSGECSGTLYDRRDSSQPNGNRCDNTTVANSAFSTGNIMKENYICDSLPSIPELRTEIFVETDESFMNQEGSCDVLIEDAEAFDESSYDIEGDEAIHESSYYFDEDSYSYSSGYIFSQDFDTSSQSIFQAQGKINTDDVIDLTTLEDVCPKQTATGYECNRTRGSENGDDAAKKDDDDECDEEEEEDGFCLVCNLNMAHMTAEDKEQHIYNCLEAFETRELPNSISNRPSTQLTQRSSTAISKTELPDSQYKRDETETTAASEKPIQAAAVDAEPGGLREKKFCCIICDLDISRRSLTSRCMHLKRCAREHGVATKELLQMIAPMAEPDIELLEDEEEEDEDARAAADDDVIVIDGDDDDDEGNARADHGTGNATAGHKKLTSGSSATAGTSKGGSDIWSRMMTASRNISSSSGGFASVAKKPSGASKKKLFGDLPEGRILAPTAVSVSTGSTESGGDAAGTGAGALSTAPATTVSNKNQPSKRAASWLGGGAKAFGGRGSGGRFGRGAGGGGRGGGSGGRWNNRVKRHPLDPSSQGGYVPAYKLIKVGNMQKPIVVDGFQYASAGLSDCYFLTHFHSDHYIGLDKDFDCGTVYCTPTTAGLVRLRIGLKGQGRVVPLELEKVHTIAVGGCKVQVILADANHCPGAACILFRFENGRQVLHTGDFRWSSELLQSPVYKSIAQNPSSNMRNLAVYLDTTYCDAAYDFPKQQLAIDAVVQCVQYEQRKAPGALFVFGAYGIGKERVFMSVAEATGMRVYVDKNRWRGMMCFDWLPEEHARLTTDPTASHLWVVPMGQVNFNHLNALRQKKPTCSRVVAFQPTGWTHPGKDAGGNKGAKYRSNEGAADAAVAVSAGLSPLLKPRSKDGNTIYAVPYSEHSSFGELVDFIKTFRPQRVIPTVNTSQEKVKQQLQLLRDASGVYGDPNRGELSSTAAAAAVVVTGNSAIKAITGIADDSGYVYETNKPQQREFI